MSSTKLGRKRAAAILSGALIKIADGALDTWVYFAHAHVFANAYTGNVALMMIAATSGDFAPAGSHLTSLQPSLRGC